MACGPVAFFFFLHSVLVEHSYIHLPIDYDDFQDTVTNLCRIE